MPEAGEGELPVTVLPPTSGCSSRTTTSSPAAARYAAPIRLLWPAPMTTMSGLVPLMMVHQSSREGVQALGAVGGHQEQFPGLHAAPLWGCHVGLDDDGHARLQRHVGGGPDRAAARADDRRQIAPAEAVDEVVDGGETGVLDDARRVDQLLRVHAGPQPRGHRVERGLRHLVQAGHLRGGLGRHGDRAQQLPRVLRRDRRAQLEGEQVTGRHGCALGHWAGTDRSGAAIGSTPT